MSTERTHAIVPAVAAAASVHAAVTLTTVPQTVATAITSPDVCRVLSITGNAAGIGGSVTATGHDANGDAVTDTVLLSGTATVLGVVAFAVVDSLIFPARTNAGDTVSVGVGDVFGLTGHIATSAAVTRAERMASGATVYAPESVGSVSALYGTVAAVVVAGDSLRWTYYDSGISGDLINQLRRRIAELTTTTYTDATLAAYIEAVPLIDADGYEPDDDEWAPVYDLSAAAERIWQEKAALLAGGYDFAADGGSFKRSQAYEMAMKQVRYWASRKAPSSLRVRVSHDYERDHQATDESVLGTGRFESYVVNAITNDDE